MVTMLLTQKSAAQFATAQTLDNGRLCGGTLCCVLLHDSCCRQLCKGGFVLYSRFYCTSAEAGNLTKWTHALTVPSCCVQHQHHVFWNVLYQGLQSVLHYKLFASPHRSPNKFSSYHFITVQAVAIVVQSHQLSLQ